MAEIQSTEDIKTRIMFIIERIEKVNEMIALHTQQNDDDFMIRQYQFRKNRLLQDLEKVLGNFGIVAELKVVV
jgi:hypothetical protein